MMKKLLYNDTTPLSEPIQVFTTCMIVTPVSRVVASIAKCWERFLAIA